MKSPMHIVTYKGLFNNTNCGVGKMTWFGGFQDDKKTKKKKKKQKNKQPFLMDRFLYYLLFSCFF
jgi:hypothetical protein